MLADESEKEFDCHFMTQAQPSLKCKVVKALSASTSNPVKVIISGMDIDITAAPHKIRLVKLKNPSKINSTLIDTQMLFVSIYVVAYHNSQLGKYKILEGTDYRVFSKNTSSLIDPSVTTVTTSTLESTTQTIHTPTSTDANALIFTFKANTSVAKMGESEGGFVVFDLPSSFSLTKGSGVSCPSNTIDANTCSTYGYPISNWLVVTLAQPSLTA
ncbi:MAG: hypothetical protein V2I33_17175 [Kangiellaceae bacterium]|jgi:hypothetical protein|nr:hypothetical protein [Kangiellaceae bacterium]